jgi:NAD(P)-dependent dehydrogenase (short-subunit alcohol dehydrogenase family)
VLINNAGVFKVEKSITRDGLNLRFAVNIKALLGKVALSNMEAYAQSKLAITMWSRIMAQILKDEGPVIIAVNPASMLGSKMVQEGFAVAGET